MRRPGVQRREKGGLRAQGCRREGFTEQLELVPGRVQTQAEEQAAVWRRNGLRQTGTNGCFETCSHPPTSALLKFLQDHLVLYHKCFPEKLYVNEKMMRQVLFLNGFLEITFMIKVISENPKMITFVKGVIAPSA